MSAREPLTAERLAEYRARLAESMNVGPVLLAGRALLAEVERLRAELEPYEALSPQRCEKGVHPDWLADSEHAHVCPWCELDRVRAERDEARARDAELEQQTEARAHFATTVTGVFAAWTAGRITDDDAMADIRDAIAQLTEDGGQPL